MRYLFQTPARYIEQTEDDRFIVSVLHEKGVREQALMDEFGRILDTGYYDISKRDFDEFYEAKIDVSTKVIIDKNGREFFRCGSRDKVYAFRDGYAVFEKYDLSRRYYVTTSGDIIGHQFKNVMGFANGLGVVQLENGKYVFIDASMNVSSPEFDFVLPFKNKDFTVAQINGKFIIIDRAFNVVSTGIKNEKGEVEPYSFIMKIDDNNIVHHRNIETDGPQCCFVDVFGNKLGTNHVRLNDFVEGIARVEDLEGTSYVNLQGEYITSEHFINCSDFSEGIAVVGKAFSDEEHLFALMRKDGTFVQIQSTYMKNNPQYEGVWVESANDFSEGICTLIVHGEVRRAVTPEGKVLKGKRWLGSFHSGLAYYQSSPKKWSFVRKNFESFEQEFDDVSYFKGKFAVVANNKRYDVIKTNELMLSEISELVAEIERNPKNIVRVPDKFYLDEELMASLFQIALDVATQTEDKEFLAHSKLISERIAEKIKEIKKIYI